MKVDLALKYQAYVDGELPEGEAGAVANTLATDSEAAALVAELRHTRELLAGNEPTVTLPESREFYWSRIRRQIERLEREPAVEQSDGLLAAWRRLLAPLAGVAVVAFLAIGLARFYNADDLTPYLAEVENLSEDSTSYSFRSDNMFVVWVQDAATEQASSDDIEFIDN